MKKIIIGILAIFMFGLPVIAQDIVTSETPQSSSVMPCWFVDCDK